MIHSVVITEAYSGQQTKEKKLFNIKNNIQTTSPCYCSRTPLPDYNSHQSNAPYGCTSRLKPGPATHDITEIPAFDWCLVLTSMANELRLGQSQRDFAPCGTHVATPTNTRKQTTERKKYRKWCRTSTNEDYDGSQKVVHVLIMYFIFLPRSSVILI